MEFCRLKYWTLLLIFVGCSRSNEFTFNYEGQYIGVNKVFDEMVVHVRKNDNISDIMIAKGLYSSLDTFSVEEKEDVMYVKTPFCSKKTSIILENFYKNNNECNPIFPFFLETITLIDSKEIEINNNEYRVLKLSSESYSESSVVYWLQGFGIILIKLEDGKYYRLKDVNNINAIPWISILNSVFDDENFSEITKIPPLPPFPY